MDTHNLTEVALIGACATWIIDKIYRIFSKTQSRNTQAIEKNTVAISELKAQISILSENLYTVRRMREDLDETRQTVAAMRAKYQLDRPSN